MPTLFVMVGMPGVGKSTYIRRLVEGFDAFVYSTDDYIEMKAAEACKTYTAFWSSEAVDEAVKWMDAEFVRAFKEGRNIIWDQTNLSPKKRRGILSRIPKGYEKVCVVFLPPETEAERAEHKRRLDSRDGKFIPASVLESMAKSYVKPTLEEGFDRVHEIAMVIQEKTTDGV